MHKHAGEHNSYSFFRSKGSLGSDTTRTLSFQLDSGNKRALKCSGRAKDAPHVLN